MKSRSPLPGARQRAITQTRHAAAPPPRRHAGLWLGALGLPLVVAVLWAVWPDEAPPAPAAPVAAAFPWDRAPGTADAPAAAGAAPAGPRMQTAAAAPAPAARGPALAEVCGLGRIALAPSGSTPGGADGADGADGPDPASGLAALPTPVGSGSLVQTRERLLASLRSTPGARAQVAAQLLQRPDTEDPQVWHAWAQATLQQALAQPDPVALGWAEEACGRLAGDGSQGQACRVALIRARLHLEPDNARHWAALADEDPTATAEAWQGLLRASRWHEAPQALVLLTQQVLPPDVPAYLRLALGAEVDAQAAALPSPGEGFLQERCSEPVPGRQAECQALAQTLVANSDATQTLALGLKLGQAAGWPEPRVRAVQQELQALASDRVRWQPEAAQPLSCRGVESWQQHLQQVAVLGELGALRQRLVETQAGR
jgi:hypothetical protein